MDEITTESTTNERWVHRAAVWVAITGTVLMMSLYLFWMIFILPSSFDDNAGKILQDHYPAVIGLPASAAISYILVVFLRQSEGPIEIGGPAFKLKGATGPIILWALCFSVITWAIKEVWALGVH